jgi:Cu(I)/Ag(I) efflux system membrane protein CusA/SilA
MVVYLVDAWIEGRASGAVTSVPELVARSLDAGARRVRPMLMTVMTNVFGLLPILLDTGVGSDVAKRIAAPMWGGLVSLTLLTLFVVPAVYVVWRSFGLGSTVEERPAPGVPARPTRTRDAPTTPPLAPATPP